MDGIIIAAVNGFFLVVVAVVEGIATVHRVRNERAAEEREAARQQRDELQTELLLSQMEISRAQTEANVLLLQHAKGEHLNGNVEACLDRLKAAEAAQDRIRDRIVAAA